MEFLFYLEEKMETFLLAIASLVILVPFVYFLPLGLSKRGKLLIVITAFLLAIVGLWISFLSPLWLTGLIMLLLVGLTTYVLDSKFKRYLYPDRTDKKADQGQSVAKTNPESHTIEKVDSQSIGTNEPFQAEEEFTLGETKYKNDSQAVEKNSLSERIELNLHNATEDSVVNHEMELPVDEHKEGMSQLERGFQEFAVSLSSNEDNQGKDSGKTVEDFSIEEGLTISEKLLQESELSLKETMNEEVSPIHDEHRDEAERLIENQQPMEETPPAEPATEEQAEPDVQENLIQEENLIEEQLIVDDEPPVEEETLVDGEEPVEEEATVEENQTPEEEVLVDVEETFEEEASIEDDQPVKEEIPIVEDNPLEEEVLVGEEKPVEEEASVEEGLPLEEEVPVEEEASVEEGLPLEEEVPVEEEASVEEGLPLEEEVPIEEEPPVQEEIPIETEYLVEEVTSLEKDKQGEEQEERALNEPRISVEEEKLPDSNLSQQSKVRERTALQQQLFSTMISQIYLMRKQLSPNEYESLVKEHLHPSLPANDYYTFASLLIEHYITSKQMEKLQGLLNDLRQRFEESPIIYMEIQYLYEHYCKNIL
jgi:membrane protein implicated in regulation of membrane protease activity